MINFFSKYKIIFYFINFILITLYIYPGSLLGCVLKDDCDTQPQISPDFLIISSNHFYVFLLITFIGFFTYKKKEIKYLIIYLLSLSIFLEMTHLIIPVRSFSWSDLFGNLLGVVIVIFIKKIIDKYENIKK
tara:strand:+ start:2320 stop:2715 length:396 start_codon:yes stop_codon:yes gene_type:complete